MTMLLFIIEPIYSTVSVMLYRPSSIAGDSVGCDSERSKIDFAELLHHFCMVQDQHRALRHKTRQTTDTSQPSIEKSIDTKLT